jgi:release factor glutamine methyltransferase
MQPRPASERLVAAALARLGSDPARVVDVGTGSGAIAIALARAAPAAEVWATDTSHAAVALARANVRRHGLANRVTVRRGDLLEPVPMPIDLVVANLPYLPASAAACRPDLDGEPAEAVFAAGDGLDHYRRLLAASSERVTPNGAVVIQLHRRVLEAPRDELDALRAEVERYAGASRSAPSLPQYAAAAA